VHFDSFHQFPVFEVRPRVARRAEFITPRRTWISWARSTSVTVTVTRHECIVSRPSSIVKSVAMRDARRRRWPGYADGLGPGGACLTFARGASGATVGRRLPAGRHIDTPPPERAGDFERAEAVRDFAHRTAVGVSPFIQPVPASQGINQRLTASPGIMPGITALNESLKTRRSATELAQCAKPATELAQCTDSATEGLDRSLSARRRGHRNRSTMLTGKALKALKATVQFTVASEGCMNSILPSNW
jgi:hypothetical protein